jgi:endonuclease/exonuclease/phosphatase family metal-dependent hydrolase
MTQRHRFTPLLIRLLLLGLAGASPPALGAQETTEPPLTPEVRELLPPPTAVPVAVRVVSFNVHYAHDVSLLAQSIRDNPNLRTADLLLIQEIESYPAEGASRARKLAKALQLNYVYAPARRTEAGVGTHGLAILSRYPLSDIEVLPLPRYDLGFNTRRRIALGATLSLPGRRLRVYNVHLDTRINTRDRIEQLRPVVEAADSHAVKEVVIGGDFNTNPFRWLFHRIPFFRSDQAGAVDAFMQENGFQAPLAEIGATLHKKLFRARVDALYAHGVKTQAAGVEREVETSDHYPVWVDVAWPTELTRTQSE